MAVQELRFKERKKAYIMRPCMIHGPGNKGNLKNRNRETEEIYCSLAPIEAGSLIPRLLLDNLKIIVKKVR